MKDAQRKLEPFFNKNKTNLLTLFTGVWILFNWGYFVLSFCWFRWNKLEVLLKQGYLGNPSSKYLFVLTVVSAQMLWTLFSDLVLELDPPFTLEVQDHSLRKFTQKTKHQTLYVHPYSNRNGHHMLKYAICHLFSVLCKTEENGRKEHCLSFISSIN